MESKETYMCDLKKWLQDTSEVPLEEMSDFFANRLSDYEEHMSIWEKSYQLFAEMSKNFRLRVRNWFGAGSDLG